MNTATFQFQGDLDFFLRPAQRGKTVSLNFGDDQSVKHLVESLGVPHTEIGRISVASQNVELGYLVRDGDQVEIQPVLPEEYDTEPRFVLDNHLGRLSAHLRMLGLDCLYRNDIQDEQLVKASLDEERILLTRDRRLLRRKLITRGCCLRSLDSIEQLQEALKRFTLTRWIKPFQRCLRCNHPLETVRKEDVLHRLEPLTRRYFDEFHLCPACNQVYWKGSHYERMMQTIAKLSG